VGPTISRLGDVKLNLLSKSNMPQKPKYYFHNAQLIRLLAAFFIVYIHQEAAFRLVFDDVKFIQILTIGTDAFLILSGFLSAYVMAHSKRTPIEFFWGRLIRIVPAYWIFNGIAYCFNNLLMGEQNSVSPTELLKSILFITYEKYPVLYPTWTLLIILQFALFLTLGFLISRRYGILLGCGLSVLFASIGFLLKLEPTVENLYTSPMLLNFVIGAVFATILVNLPTKVLCSKPTKMYLAFTGWFLIVIGGALISARPYFWPELPRIFAGALPAAAIVFGAIALDLGEVSIKNVWLEKLTELTFMIYLSHVFWNIFLEKIAVTLGQPIVTVLLMVLTPIPVAVMAWIAYHRIEVPIANRLANSPPFFVRKGTILGKLQNRAAD